MTRDKWSLQVVRQHVQYHCGGGGIGGGGGGGGGGRGRGRGRGSGGDGGTAAEKKYFAWVVGQCRRRTY